MTPETTEADHFGIEPYEIPGYEWERKTGDEIGEGTLFPGHSGEVWELVERCGYSMDASSTYYIAVMVADGSLGDSVLPGWSNVRDRERFNDAVRERVDRWTINDQGEKEYWTLTEADK